MLEIVFPREKIQEAYPDSKDIITLLFNVEIPLFLKWLGSEMKNMNITPHGFMCLNNDTAKKDVHKDPVNSYSVLVFLDDCDKINHKKVLDVLQQPPEPYRGRYIARIVSAEPDPVKVTSLTVSSPVEGEPSAKKRSHEDVGDDEMKT